ncbi:MAG: universal stress protein [Rhodospirillales bacterium]|nr:universal stress protein [Rhodospirillales bacterium]
MRARDLLVVLDASPHNGARLDLALDLARAGGAHLSGLCPLELLLPPDLGIALGGYPEVLALQSAMDQLGAQAESRAAEIEAEFREALRRNGVAGEFRTLPGPVAPGLAAAARHADATLIGQPDPEYRQPPAGRHMLEDVLLAAGRPLLILPYAGRFPAIGRKVLIAWSDTREAARAVADALPLIEPDAEVTVLTVARPAAARTTDVPGAEIAAHLARHGFSVTATRAVTDGTISEADALLDYASDLGADLLVMGGYGHSRVRELALGGVTRSILAHMTLPVLMSH